MIIVSISKAMRGGALFRVGGVMLNTDSRHRLMVGIGDAA